MSDLAQAGTATSPAAPSSADGGSASIVQHSPPNRAPRSARESANKTPPRAPGREERPADPMADIRSRLKAEPKDDEDDGATANEADDVEVHDATGADDAEPVEAKEPDELTSAKERLTAAEAHIEEVHRDAQKVIRDFKMAEKKADFYKRALDEAFAQLNEMGKAIPGFQGYELDPRAIKLMEFEAEREIGSEGEKQQTEAQTAAHKAQVDSEVKRTSAEIAKASKAAGVDAKSLTRRYIASVQEWMAGGEQGPEPTVNDVVEEVRALSAHKQAKVSATAPRLTKGSAVTKAAAPQFQNNHAGWRAALKANGVG